MTAAALTGRPRRRRAAHAGAHRDGALLRLSLRGHVREGALERRGPDRAQRHHDDPLPDRVRGDRAPPAAANERDRARILRGLRAGLSRRLLEHRHAAGADPVHEGDGEVRHPLRLPRRGDRLPRAARRALLLASARLVHGRLRRERRLRDPPARLPARRSQPRQPPPQPAHGRRGQHQHLRRDRRPEHLPGQRAHRRSEPPRRDADRAAADADAGLPAVASRSSPQVAAGDRARLPAARGHRDVLAQRRRRAHRRRPRARGALSPLLPLEAVSLPARLRRGRAPRRALHPQALLRDLPEAASLDAGQLGQRALRGLLVHRRRSCTCTPCSGSATTTSPSTTSS